MNAPNFLYFAYGSNMNPERIRHRLPEARAVGRATLHGWRLVERLYADIERAKGGRVNGVLYCVTPTELHRLDAYEGFPKVYDCLRVSVHAELMNVEEVRYRVPAFTYVMTEAARRERNGKRYPEDYRITCAVGARYWKLPNNPFGVLQPTPEKRGWFGLW
jgi:gamma-glutamylcyclotransferase (GGCT)/AIG2-like uncharacterized protein YtfP